MRYLIENVVTSVVYPLRISGEKSMIYEEHKQQLRAKYLTREEVALLSILELGQISTTGHLLG